MEDYELKHMQSPCPICVSETRAFLFEKADEGL